MQTKSIGKVVFYIEISPPGRRLMKRIIAWEGECSGVQENGTSQTPLPLSRKDLSVSPEPNTDCYVSVCDCVFLRCTMHDKRWIFTVTNVNVSSECVFVLLINHEHTGLSLKMCTWQHSATTSFWGPYVGEMVKWRAMPPCVFLTDSFYAPAILWWQTLFGYVACNITFPWVCIRILNQIV